MKLCGLTGGIGMGKSTAAGFLSRLGAKVADTDDIARDLVAAGQPALREIAGIFGSQILLPDGSLDRRALAARVFESETDRKRLEAVLHPLIRAAWVSQVRTWRQGGCAVGVVVIPLLFETGAEHEFDRILCVACSPSTQLHRLRMRGWDDAQIASRNAAQIPADEKMARSHFVVWTEGDPDMARLQLEHIYSRL